MDEEATDQEATDEQETDEEATDEEAMDENCLAVTAIATAINGWVDGRTEISGRPRCMQHRGLSGQPCGTDKEATDEDATDIEMF